NAWRRSKSLSLKSLMTWKWSKTIFALGTCFMTAPQYPADMSMATAVILALLGRSRFQKDFNRLGWVVRTLVQRQHVFHALAKLFREFRDAPVFFRHGLKSCRCSQSETWLLLSAGTKPRATASRHNSFNVQRAYPSGGWVQAKAMTCCCCLAVNFGGPPGRFASKTARSQPPKQHRLRISAIVRTVKPTCSAIAVSIRPASDLSKTCARRTTATGRVPARTSSCNDL